jgi:hypothetical protein
MTAALSAETAATGDYKRKHDAQINPGEFAVMFAEELHVVYENESDADVYGDEQRHPARAQPEDQKQGTNRIGA